MDYTSEANMRDSRTYMNAAQESAPRPTDLNGLRCQIEDITARARECAARVEVIGETVLGMGLPKLPEGRASPGVPPSVVDLIGELDSTITRLGIALNRL